MISSPARGSGAPGRQSLRTGVFVAPGVLGTGISVGVGVGFTSCGCGGVGVGCGGVGIVGRQPTSVATTTASKIPVLACFITSQSLLSTAFADKIAATLQTS